MGFLFRSRKALKLHVDKLSCSFCGKRQTEVRKLIAGPTVYICDNCVEERVGIARFEGKHPLKVELSDQTLCCSFCGKLRREVRALVRGPTIYICVECLGLCQDILAEEID